jgi:hypothetical protein
VGETRHKYNAERKGKVWKRSFLGNKSRVGPEKETKAEDGEEET